MVGTIYVQDSPFHAKEIGAKLITKNISGFLERIADLALTRKPFLIYCWRGGMRSRSLFTIMEMIGYKTFLLDGGYKAYRRLVHSALEHWNDDPVLPPITTISLHGYTGTGKSELLERLRQEGYPIVDLEALANHRGSLLGSLTGTRQPSQKKFESALFFALHGTSSCLIVEGESRKIGKNYLPDVLWQLMKTGMKIWLELPRTVRIRNLLRMYTNEIDLIRTKLAFFKPLISKVKFDELQTALNEKNLEAAARIFLEEYYDPLYAKHGPQKNPQRYLCTIRADTNEELYEQLIQQIKTISDAIPARSRNSVHQESD